MLVTLASAVIACSRSANAPIDLVYELRHAERRAAKPIDEAVRTDTITVSGGIEPVVITEPPARVIYRVRMPSRSSFHARVALMPGAAGQPRGASIRIGLSDDRFYDELVRIPLTPATGEIPQWQPVDVDLGAYSGWQWSIFYRPSQITWKLILNADATPGGTVAWAAPVIRN